MTNQLDVVPQGVDIKEGWLLELIEQLKAVILIDGYEAKGMKLQPPIPDGSST